MLHIILCPKTGSRIQGTMMASTDAELTRSLCWSCQIPRLARTIFLVPPSPLCPSQYPAFARRINSTHDPLHTHTAGHFSGVKTKYSLTSKLHTGPALASHAFHRSTGACWIPDVLPPAFPRLFLSFCSPLSESVSSATPPFSPPLPGHRGPAPFLLPNVCVPSVNFIYSLDRVSCSPGWLET